MIITEADQLEGQQLCLRVTNRNEEALELLEVIELTHCIVQALPQLIGSNKVGFESMP